MAMNELEKMREVVIEMIMDMDDLESLNYVRFFIIGMREGGHKYAGSK